MKKSVLNENSKISSIITIGDMYLENDYMYLEYDFDDSTYYNEIYSFPFIVEVNLVGDTQIIGELKKGKKVQVRYKNLNENLEELELELIKIIE